MAGRRILYAVLVGAAVLFQIFFRFYLSTFVLVLILVFPILSLLLALLRKVVLLIPLIYILPFFFEDKLFGVFVAEPIADILAATATTISFLLWTKKNLRDDLPKTSK